MAEVVTCPDRTTLERLLGGLVSDDAAAELEQHLLGCQHCCQAARELLPVTQHSLSVAAQLATNLSEEQAVREVAVRVATLRLPERSAPNMETLAAASEGTKELDDFATLLDPPESPGEIGRFGGYRILRLLGSGGMGLVWEAEDPQLRRHVAIKVMKSRFAKQAEHRERFLREARAAAAIDHSHIVTVYQVGEHRGTPFLAMQLLRGETLEDLLQREGRLPPAECLRIGRQMAEALAMAHRRGLIHRDVKPGNTWLESDGGWVKLVDFGLAHVVEDDTHLTQTGMILGTPAFMSPEQARGEPVHARSDLFSLGAVLYRMTTGVGPFQGPSTLAVLTSLALRNPEPPRQLNADVSAEFSDLIMRLLAKDPGDRPASAEAVVATIRTIERCSPKSEVQSPNLEVAGVESKRCPGGDGTRRRAVWPWVVAAAGAAAVLLAAITVIFRDKDGKILGTHTYPDADSAEVRHTDSAANAKVAPTLRSGEPVAEGDREIPSRSAGATLSEPPPLDKWLAGRTVLTVSKDDRGQFKTIQAALDALKPGQAVEVLDRGPYRETLAFGGQKNVGLFSRANATVVTGAKRTPHFEGDIVEVHNLPFVDRFRLSGVTFLADAKDLAEVRDGAPWFAAGLSGDVTVESCHFAGGRPGVEMLVYWHAEAPTGAACTIRDCLFDTAIAVNVRGGRGRAISTIERNWFRASGGYFPLYIDGSAERTVVRHNVFDVRDKAAVGFADAGSTGTLELCNNTVFGWINFGATDPDRPELLSPANALVRNNLFLDVVSCKGQPGSLNAAAKSWQIGNNQYGKAPDTANQLSPTALDFTGKPSFFARDPTDRQYARIAADSQEARRGAGGELPAYLGALPPGPAPNEGDWLTRWIERSNEAK